MRLAAALLPLLAMAACSVETPERQERAQPSIVSLNPCADAILAEVAAPGQLLAISHYSHDPAASSMPADQAARYASTGGTAEEVIALAPDVVVADSFLAPATRSALERARIRVKALGIAGDVESSIAQVRQMAAVTGERTRGEALARRIDAAWEAADHAGDPVSTLLWQEGGIVPGPDSLVARMLERSGFTLHSAARGLGQGAYLPLEEVLADPPELVLAAGDERMLTHPVLRQVPGLRYETFDSALLYCGGPTIPRALARLEQVREAMR